MALHDTTVSGIIDGRPLEESTGWLYGDTLLFREDWGLPAHLLVIQADEDTPHCLDATAPGDG